MESSEKTAWFSSLTNVLLVGIKTFVAFISEHFGEAPFFRLLSVHQGEGNITNEVLLKNPYLKEEKAKGIKVEMVENELGQYIEDIHFQEFNQEKTDLN